MLCLWRVEVGTRTGQREVRLHAAAVDSEGRRLPSIERHVDAVLRAAPARPAWTFEDRMKLLASAAEPALQRGLRQCATATESGGYSPELVGYVELVASR